jgi:hypothetical protein
MVRLEARPYSHDFILVLGILGRLGMKKKNSSDLEPTTPNIVPLVWRNCQQLADDLNHTQHIEVRVSLQFWRYQSLLSMRLNAIVLLHNH